MINDANFREVLRSLGFSEESNDYMSVEVHGFRMAANFRTRELEYPEPNGLKVNERQTCNFSMNENFVVFECVHRLLAKGYMPKNIELEPRWQLGRGSSGGRADILVRSNDGRGLLLIECKTPGVEFDREWRTTLQGTGQLFSYAQQASEIQFLTLYTSDYEDGEVRYTNHIIAHRDNEKYVNENPSLATFKDANSTEERYAVWKHTYKFDFTTKGIFESDIQPYNIGKNKYTVNDLVGISESDRRKKYNEFATILRQHNVSGRENAFDKLVNLLLCKVVDEATNGDDLQFYWKGVAYDTQIELLDRLQRLYQAGMRKFLREDITYINEDDVNNALRFIKTNPDSTQRAVWNLFVQQKFYTNNDFSFIDVHNEQLFYQNSEVLVRILQMWQDVRLTTEGASFNQFLGDMFEGFLDQGVKQSEGQFFTPIPLARFIIQSLPLKTLLSDSEPPRVLDYACGAGHFLTEYSVQVADLLRTQTASQEELAKHHENVFGIEKEYRLSKVAKVSTFMYGQPGIHIVYGDALAHNHPAYPQIQSESFDLLVANPPYSVKGFLETLSPEDLAEYELTDTIGAKGRDTANRIEAFFIERAKQLLRPGGIAAIVLPSSVFSNNDRPTRAARDILLDYFDLLAMVELGPGAFGSTGTSTVTVFLRRKGTSPDTVAHLHSRVHEWFKGHHADRHKQASYDDWRFVEDYASYIGVNVQAYEKFVSGEGIDEILKADEIFVEYAARFERDASTVKWKRSKAYASLPVDKKREEEERLYSEYVAGLERQKLLAFCVARTQSEPVLIVRSPDDTKSMKRFLGYSWSKAKGKEGIKILRDQAGHHVTPLYDETDRSNPAKINSYIAANFDGLLTDVPENLSQYATVAPLEHLLDFRTPEFDRSISLTPRGPRKKLESKFPLRKLGTIVAHLHRGASPRPIDQYLTEEENGIPWIKIGDAPRGVKRITSTSERITAEGAEKSRSVKKGDFILSNSMSAGRPYIVDIDGCVHDGWLILSGIDQSISKDYLFYVLSDEFVQAQLRDRARGPVVQNLNISRVESVLVPIADSATQEALVAEAHNIERQIDRARTELESLNADILRRVGEFRGRGDVRLDKVANHIVESVDPLAENAPARYIGLESIESDTGTLADAIDSGLLDAQSSKRLFGQGDVLYGKLRPRLNKVYLAESSGMCSTDIMVFRFGSIEAASFYSLFLRTPEFNNKVVATVTNTMPRTSWDRIKGLPVPELDQLDMQQWFERLQGYRREVARLEAEISHASGEMNQLVRRFL